MLFKRSTAMTLATVATTLGVAGPAVAVPAHDPPVGSTGSSTSLTAASPSSTNDEGLDTLAVVLLSTGALVAGAAAGFGGAKASAGRASLHPH